jgi:hypothetical protein
MDRKGNTISKPPKIREPWRAVFPISKWPGNVRRVKAKMIPLFLAL